MVADPTGQVEGSPVPLRGHGRSLPATLWPVEPKEALEQVEHAEEAAERREAFGRRAAVLVSVLAALLAIATLAGNRAATDAILWQQRASDTYNEYQANSLKRHINEGDAALLRVLAAGGPREQEASQVAGQLEQAVADKYRPEQDRLLPEAQAQERERDTQEARHRGFQVAEAAFQLGIVLSSVAIVARASALLWAAAGLGVVGLLVMLNTFLLLVPLPA
jgi:hypothetical protein